MNQKYEISEIAHPKYPWLHRIRALSDVRPGVQKGDLGGYVQGTENLSQEGTCWIFDNAIACDDAFVNQQAVLSEYAVVRGSALVSGNANVRGNAVVDDHALVMNGTVRGYAHVAGNACICADKVTEHEPTVQEHASVYGVVAGNVCVEESAIVLPGARIENPTPDRFVPFPVSWTVKMKKKQKETQDILSYHTQAAGCSDKARAKASGGRQPIEECGRTGL